MMLMMVFQGLRHPAPFSDELEPVEKPYKRVSMDEAKQGTSSEWDFQKNPTYGCILEKVPKLQCHICSHMFFVTDSADGKRHYLIIIC